MALLPGARFGAYEVTASLGAGGMGEVYRAHDANLKRDVALKVLPGDVAGDPERLTRFRREAELLAALNHSNIAQIYGVERSGASTALVMELVDGEDLSARIARGRVPVDEALQIALQIAAALEAAHDQGIVHRDLKPANVMLRRDGTIKVLDFGLAKSVAARASAEATMTAASSPGAVLGTPAYMSPEQARGEAVGKEADIWAFGVVLYEVLSGVSPFARASTADTLAQVLTSRIDEELLPAETPGSIRRLIRWCVEKDPRRRWRHIGDARIEIADALADTAPSPTVNGLHAAAPVSRRKALIYGAASLALMAAGAGGGVWFDRRQQGAVAPSYRRLTFRRGLVRSARFAPDGKTILYGALWDDDRCRVHTVRVDGPESRPLEWSDANLLAVSRSGELALSLGSHDRGILTYGTLARVPMTGAAPREVLEQVKFADWSPDGEQLAIVRRVNGRDQLEFPIGNVLFAPADADGTSLGFARISPDGRSIACVHYRRHSELGGRVVVIDQASRASVLSPDYTNIHGLTWKGNDIVYTAADDQPLFRALFAVGPDGHPRVITRIPGNATLWDTASDGHAVMAQTDDRALMIAERQGDTNERDLSWLDASWVEDLSSDGQSLLFTEFGQGGGAKSAAYLRRTDGSPAVRLSDGRAMALSPDGRWVVCRSPVGTSSSMTLVPTGPGEPRTLPNHGLAYVAARWLPDGKRLIVSAQAEGRRSRLYLYDLNEGAPAAITPEGVSAWAPSPDGSAVAVREGDQPIRLYPLDGSPPRTVPGLTGTESPVGWIADGLLVMRPGDPASPLGQIYRIALPSGEQQPWKNIFPRDRAGIMGQFAYCVTPDGASHAYSWHRALSNLWLSTV